MAQPQTEDAPEVDQEQPARWGVNLFMAFDEPKTALEARDAFVATVNEYGINTLAFTIRDRSETDDDPAGKLTFIEDGREYDEAEYAQYVAESAEADLVELVDETERD